MKHLYEIFEQFPDRSSLWKESALGEKKTQRKLTELAKKSLNPIYAVDLTSGEVLRMAENSGRDRLRATSTGALKKIVQPNRVV